MPKSTNEQHAIKLAAAIGGRVEHTGGNVWVVILKTKSLGRCIVFDGESISEYHNRRAYDAGDTPISVIYLY